MVDQLDHHVQPRDPRSLEFHLQVHSRVRQVLTGVQQVHMTLDSLLKRRFVLPHQMEQEANLLVQEHLTGTWVTGAAPVTRPSAGAAWGWSLTTSSATNATGKLSTTNLSHLGKSSTLHFLQLYLLLIYNYSSLISKQLDIDTLQDHQYVVEMLELGDADRCQPD